MLIILVQIILTLFFAQSVINAVIVRGKLDFISYAVALSVTLWFLGDSLGVLMTP